MRSTAVCVVLCLQLTGVLPYTLYKWILDSQMRFNYDPDPSNSLGVSNWPRTYNEDCGGPHQSPVNIQTDQVRYGVSCRCPDMAYDSHIMRGELKNNGHSTTFEPETPMTLRLSNVPYRDGTYLFNDFHLHYGGVRGRDFELQGLRFRGSGVMSAGSEHTIDGLRFEGEMHFVFYNSKYASLEMADSKHDGVVIITLMVQKVPEAMVEDTRFSSFLEHNIPLVAPYLANISTTVDMSMFFNRDCEFYTYAGSTTTPTCHESVRWIILKDPLRVTERAWFRLTGLKSRGDFNARFGNYRTTQPLNDRVVEANFRRSEGVALPMPNSDIVDRQQRLGQSMVMVPVDTASSADIPNRQLGTGRQFMDVPRMEIGAGPQAMVEQNMNFGLRAQAMAVPMVARTSPQATVDQSMGMGFGTGGQGIGGPNIGVGTGIREMGGQRMNIGTMPRMMDIPSMGFGPVPQGLGGQNTGHGIESQEMGGQRINTGTGMGQFGMTGQTRDMNFGQMQQNRSATVLSYPQPDMPVTLDFGSSRPLGSGIHVQSNNIPATGAEPGMMIRPRSRMSMQMSGQGSGMTNQMRADGSQGSVDSWMSYLRQMMTMFGY